MTITILGEGAWGTACATLFAYNGHKVILWCYHPQIADEIQKTRFNSTYLPKIKLDENIFATNDIEYAINEANLIVEAIPVVFLRSIFEKCKKIKNSQQKPWLLLSKGIEQETLFFPSQILLESIGKNTSFAVLSGPSFAIEVARKKMTGVMVASIDNILSKKIEKIISNEFFKTKNVDDIIGLQTGGALKNIIALTTGLLNGANYGDNSKALIITQALKEISILTEKLGGKKETIYDLAGLGDLVLTSLSTTSKNYRFGQEVGKGFSIKEVLNKIKTPPEGINTLKSVNIILKKHNLNLQLIQNIYNFFIYKKKDINFIFNFNL